MFSITLGFRQGHRFQVATLPAECLTNVSVILFNPGCVGRLNLFLIEGHITFEFFH